MSTKKDIIDKLTVIFRELSSYHDSWKNTKTADAAKVRTLQRRVDYCDQKIRDYQNDAIEVNANAADKKDQVSDSQFDSSLLLVDALYEIIYRLDNSPKPVPASTNIALPKVQLPVFDGNLDRWPEFKDLFEAVVHKNASLTNIQKFSYLRGQLKNEPLALVTAYEFDDKNYATAYDCLKKRFESSRRRASFFVNKILHAKLNHKNLATALESVRGAINSLKNMPANDMADYLLFELTYCSCDETIQKKYDETRNTNDLPDTQSLILHLENMARHQELHPTTSATPAKLEKKRSFVTTAKDSTAKGKLTCKYCSDSSQSDHSIYSCEKFLKLSGTERLDAVKQKRLCFNCLSGHSVSFCRSSRSCSVCHKKHHSLIHEGVVQAHKPAELPPQVETATCLATQQNVEALLGTIQCYVRDVYGQLIKITLLLDQGSQTTLMTAQLADRLGFRRQKDYKSMVGISQAGTKSLGSMELVLQSLHHEKVKYSCTASILEKICCKLPSISISSAIKNKFKNMELGDPDFAKTKNIDLLLNVQALADIMSTESPNFLPGEPAAMKTIFGWVIFGTIPMSPPSTSISLLCVESLDTILKKFWEVEEVPMKPPKNPEHIAAESHFEDTYCRMEDGRFKVRLPFKAGAQPEKLYNRDVALRSYQALERRLSRQDEVKASYTSFMQEIVDLGHMVPAKEPANYVLPHLIVQKESTSTKTRAVFHASHRASCGQSLNDLLLTGPKLQKNVSDIIINFRFHVVALTADAKMMYRMIMIHEDDRKFQHIFWRPHPDSEVVEYELQRLVYGMAPSSFIAQRCILQLAKDIKDNMPAVSTALEKELYMDDCCTGSSSVTKAVHLRDQLIKVFNSAGFELRKWCSSHPEVLEGLPAEHVEKLQVFDSGETGIKVLGLCWDPVTDEFSYQVKSFKGENSKRSVLSLIAKLFDVCGYIQPVIITGKLIMQRLWLLKIDWDDPLPSDIYAEWSNYANSLPQLTNLKIKRHISLDGVLRIVGFADSSEVAYACVCYAQVSRTDGTYSSQIIASKSRVAPLLKKENICRLELLACLLLSRLLKSIMETINQEMVASIHLFSDSSVALTWIHTPAYLLKTYVCNRVQEIHDTTQEFRAVWNHCPTQINPADCASRGLQPPEILSHPLWWSGPDFLLSDVSYWPTGRPAISGTIPQSKNQVFMIHVEPPVNEFYEYFEKFSSLEKLQRVIAYILRFANNALARRRRTSKIQGPLQVPELDVSLLKCIKITQERDFCEEIKNGVNSKRLVKLAPHFDTMGYLRVGGRLKASSLPETQKHPLLLTKNCHIAKLICEHTHKVTIHSGLLTTMAEIQRKYWILSLRSLARSVIGRCLRCFKVGMKPGNAYMADLPAPRVTASHCFKHVGTDYAGPFTTKSSTLRYAKHQKSYVCLFVCFATTACHIEVVSELTTAAFSAALTRMVSRRGLCSDLYSDCGSNYLGYANELKEIYQFIESHKDELVTDASSHRIRHHFNSPLASHHGGLWEANVKVLKQLLHRQIGNSVLTFEELTTLLTRIEATMNSRPLEFSSDPNDGYDYLTPGHFLIGSSLLSTPEVPLDLDVTPRQRWVRVRQVAQHIWNRWSKSYLNSLTQRLKWTHKSENLRVGQVVYVVELNTASLSWPIGRIMSVHPGKDGVVRIVTVRVRGKDFLRPITKVVAAPV